MANLHEIKAHIANVNSTKKITRAMYLISASKSQKAKAQLVTTAPYFQHIKSTMAQILACADELDTPYVRANDADTEKSAPEKDLYFVIAGDKGMAGGYNNNLIALATKHVRKDVDDVMVAGFVGRHKIQQLGYHVNEDCVWPVMNPSLHRAWEIAEYILSRYLSGEYRRIHVIFSEMVTALKQVPTILQLLPLDLDALCTKPIHDIHAEEFLPNARVVFDHLVPHYLKGILYSALVEAFSSEQSARMFAMDGATKSANETIDKLSVTYNRARQAKITQELTEIISGIPTE